MVILYVIFDPCNAANYLKMLIPVRTELIMIADVKYANLSVSGFTVHM